MTQSGIKSRSSKGGSPANFNEIRFEDKKGSEEVYIHAEKDFNRVVENNDTLKVGFEKQDEGSQTITIYKHRSVTLSTGDDTLTVAMGHHMTEALTWIELKVGPSSITITPAGITLRAATKISLEAPLVTILTPKFVAPLPLPS